jgi:hypothetical protein
MVRVSTLCLGVAGTLSACLSPPTLVTVIFETDAPASNVVGARIALRRGILAGSRIDGESTSLRYPDGAAAAFGTFALVPSADAPRDQEFSGQLEIEVRSESRTRIAYLRRFFRGRFVPSVPMEYRIFLPLRCGATADDCRTVPPYDCTIGVRCEELGLTCGDDGRCVDPLLRPDRSGEAAVFRQGEEGGVEIPLADSGLDAAMDVGVEDVRTADASTFDSACGPTPECTPNATRGCACNGQERCLTNCTWSPCSNQCGCNGQSCCGSNCNGGLSCQSGTCRPCGAEGQPCCAASCNSGLTCSSGTCRRPACTPNCPSGRNCGMPDGCGNRCTSCGGCDLMCNTSTGACIVTPCPSGRYRCEGNCRCCAGCDANDRCCTPPRCS